MTTGASSSGEPSLELTDPGEKAAFALVPANLGAGVWAEPYDHSGRQEAVDVLLHYPDGRDAAMEVTTAAAPRMRQLDKLLAEHETLPNPDNWTWSATIDDPRDLPDLLDRVGSIILLCEAHGVREPGRAYHLRREPDIGWLMRSAVEMHGSPELPKMDGDRERPMTLTTGGRRGEV